MGDYIGMDSTNAVVAVTGTGNGPDSQDVYSDTWRHSGSRHDGRADRVGPRAAPAADPPGRATWRWEEPWRGSLTLR